MRPKSGTYFLPIYIRSVPGDINKHKHDTFCEEGVLFLQFISQLYSLNIKSGHKLDYILLAFYNQGSCVKVCFLQTNKQDAKRICLSYFWQSWKLDTYRITTLRRPRMSEVLETKHKTRFKGPQWVLCQLKKPFKGVGSRRGICYGEKRTFLSKEGGHWFRQINDKIYQKQIVNNGLLARPQSCSPSISVFENHRPT